MTTDVSGLEQAYGIPQGLYGAIINQGESSGVGAVSPKGAIGQAQLMPATAAAMGVDPTDPDQNLVGGARYTAQLYQKYKDPALVAAAYNAGPGAVDHHGGVPPYKETQAYVGRVMDAYSAVPSDDELNTALQQAQKAGATTAQPRPAHVTALPTDVANHIHRNPDGSIAAIGDEGSQQLNSDGSLDVDINATTNPEAIAAYLAAHPEDPANHLTSQPSDDDLQKSFDAQTGGQAVPAAPQTTAPSKGDAAADTSLLGKFAPGLAAGLDKAVDTATGGFAAKGRAFVDALPALAQGQRAFSNQYSANLTGLQGQQQNEDAAHPVASALGWGYGALGQAAMLPAAAPAGLGARLGVGALQGGALSAFDSIGHARGGVGQELSGAVVPTIAGAGVGALAGGVLGNKLPSAAPQTAALSDYATAGVDPMLAVNGSRSAQQIGQMLKGVPIVGSPLAKAAARTTAQVGAGVTREGTALGASTTPEAAGSALQQGALDAVDAMKQESARLHQPVNALEENAMPIAASHTQAATQAMFDRFPNTAALFRKQAPQVAQIHDALAAAPGQKITFAELKALRSNIGAMLEDHGVVGNIDKARLKQLYGAMSKDLESGAEQLGGKDALTAMQKANAHTAHMHSVIDETLSRVIGKDSTGAMIPREAAFARVQSAARGGSRADIQQIEQLRDALPAKAWREVGAGVVHGLGKSADGFSPARFATEWSKLTPEAKAAILPKETVKGLDALSRVSKQIANASKFYNHSSSGSHVIGAAMLLEPAEEIVRHAMTGNLHGALSSFAAPVAAGTVGGVTAKLLASPGFARLLLRSSAIEKTPRLVDQLFARYAADNPAIRTEVKAVQAQVMRRLLSNSPSALSSAAIAGRSANLSRRAQPALQWNTGR